MWGSQTEGSPEGSVSQHVAAHRRRLMGSLWLGRGVCRMVVWGLWGHRQHTYDRAGQHASLPWSHFCAHQALADWGSWHLCVDWVSCKDLGVCFEHWGYSYRTVHHILALRLNGGINCDNDHMGRWSRL